MIKSIISFFIGFQIFHWLILQSEALENGGSLYTDCGMSNEMIQNQQILNYNLFLIAEQPSKKIILIEHFFQKFKD